MLGRLALVGVAMGSVLPLAACSQPATPTSEPLTSENVRERVVEALTREGKVVRFEAVSPNDGVVELSGWLDLPQRRGRSEQGDGAVTVAVDGKRARLVQGRLVDSLSEMAVVSVVPLDSSLPAALDNPGLTVIVPLTISLFSGDGWAEAGVVDWEGSVASAWEASVDLGEGGEYDGAIYLDPVDAMPLGQEWKAKETGEIEYSVSYLFEFVDPSEVPAGAFDINGMRGDLLATVRGYEAVWLGTETGPIGGLPSLSLDGTRVSHRAGEEFVEFKYQVFNRIPLARDARFGLMEITVRPTPSWEKYVEDRDLSWLEDAPRERVAVLGGDAELAVESFNETNAALWQGDTVVSFETSAFTDPIPGEWYEGGVAPTTAYDRNSFNNADAVRSLLPLLRRAE